METQNETFRIGDALKTGFDGATANFISFFAALIITFGAELAWAGLLSGFFGWNTIHRDIGLPFLLRVIGQLIIGFYAAIGLIKLSLGVVDGRKVNIREFFHNFKEGWAFAAASVLMGLLVAAGFLLFVIPGIIAAIAFHYYRYLVVDKGMSPVDSLKKAAELSKGFRWRLLGFFILVALINGLGVLCFFVGVFLTIPLSMIADAYVYRRLSASHQL